MPDQLLTIDGRAGNILHYPTPIGGAPPLSLAIGLHGDSGNAAQFRLQTSIEPYTDSAQTAVLWLQGTEGTGPTNSQDPKNPANLGPTHLYWNAGNCFGSWPIDDTFILDGVAAVAGLGLPINTNKIFCFGFSGGGDMSWTMAQLHPDKVFGIARVAGNQQFGGPGVKPSACPEIAIHGRDDQLTWFNGQLPNQNTTAFYPALLKMPQFQLISLRAIANSCDLVPAWTHTPAGQNSYTTWTYHGGNGKGLPTVLVRIMYGGHNWPGGSNDQTIPIFGPWTNVNINEMIRDFLVGILKGNIQFPI